MTSFYFRTGLTGFVLFCLTLWMKPALAGPCTFTPSFRGDTLVCSGSVVKYVTTKTTGHTYKWTVTGGTIVFGALSDSMMVSWTTPGKGTIKLVDATSTCKDSITRNVKIGLSASTLAQSTYALLGSATASGKTVIVTNNGTSTTGAAWNKTPISLTNNFDFTFTVNQCGNADGMMFVLQNSGLSAIGANSAGSAMGYYDATGNIFNQSLAIELDIYNSGATVYADSTSSHFAIVKNKNTTPLKPTFTWTSGINSCADAKFRVVWNATLKQLTCYYNGTKVVNTYSIDLVSTIFNGNPNVYFGFTGSTGAITSVQKFTNDTLIYGRPIITPKSALNMCQGDSNFLSATNGVSYLWSSGEKTKTIKVTKAGSYAVAVIDSTNCMNWSDSVKIKVSAAPVFKIGSGRSICPGGSVTIGPGTSSAYSYSWSSKPVGFSSTNAQETVAPTISTTYYLTVTDKSSGCTAKDSVKISMNPTPKVAFTASSGCVNGVITFTNTSSITAGSLKYLWKFGDGTTSALASPTKSYSKAGAYNVWLIAASDSGCRDSIQKRVTVYQGASVDFNFNAGCFGSSTVFANNSSYALGSITGYHWDFGDGTSSTLSDPTKTYTKAGVYHVWLAVTTDKGCRDSIEKDVTISALPVSGFTVSSACQGDSVRFSNTSTITSGFSISSYRWTFGDGGTSLLKSPAHRYATAGNYKVTLVSTGDGGCTDTFRYTLVLKMNPKVYMKSISRACTGNNTVFTDSTLTDAGVTKTTWLWNFGDGKTSALQNPVHVYASAGTYNIWLKVGTSTGCIDSARRTITVYATPDSSFSMSKVKYRNYMFTANAKGLGSYTWNFGDGTNPKTVTSDTITHNFAKDGTYSVMLSVAGANQCSASMRQSLVINTTALEANEKEPFDWRLYPNPFSDQFSMDYSLDRFSKVRISILDMNGQEVALIAQGDQAAGQYNYTLNTQDYGMKAGVYVVRMIVDGQILNKPLVRMK